MNATQCKAGKVYRVVALRKPEYLTIGEEYRATGGINGGRGSLGMHRVSNGAGTYLRPYDAQFVDVIEVQS
jgi:hypothetical protein